MNRCRMGLFLIMVVALSGFAGNCGAQFAKDVRIVNKATLPPERLADALAAKALLTNSDPKLLRNAAELAPRDPRYWYLSAITRYVYVMGTRGYVPFEKIEPVYRTLLERALTADPNSLPALYAYVLSKPTHDQQMRGLERLTALDPDNAKPYYLMAIELYQQTARGRAIIRSSGLQPYPMSREEWGRVIGFIREGNQRPTSHADAVRLPSAADLRVTASGKVLPKADLETGILLAEDACRSAELFPTAAYCRQLARQAVGKRGKHISKGGWRKPLICLR